MIRVYSPGPFGTGGALRSGKPTGPEAMFSLAAAGSGGNAGGRNVGGRVCCAAPDPEKSLVELSGGWARKSLVNSPAEGAEGAGAGGGDGDRPISGVWEISRPPVCPGR